MLFEERYELDEENGRGRYVELGDNKTMVCRRKLRGEWLVMEVNLVVVQLDYVLSPSWSRELCLCLCCSCFVLLWNEKGKWRKTTHSIWNLLPIIGPR